jgi:hypothetical protein
MNRERKPPFDPKAFLSKVSGGRAISDYRKDQNVYTQGEPATKFRSKLHGARAPYEPRDPRQFSFSFLDDD